MKKLLSATVFLIIPFFSIAQNMVDTLPHKDGRVIYEKVYVKYGKTKDDLYNAAKKWMVANLNSVQQSITSTDEQQGQILGTASFKTYQYQSNSANRVLYKYDFKVQIDCKDNKYRIRLYDFASKDKFSPNPVSLTWDYTSSVVATRENIYDLDHKLKDILESLSDLIDKSANDDF